MKNYLWRLPRSRRVRQVFAVEFDFSGWTGRKGKLQVERSHSQGPEENVAGPGNGERAGVAGTSGRGGEELACVCRVS